jgi:hypothetical protein
MKLCPYCEGQNEDEDAFCRHCGHRQPSKQPDGNNDNDRKDRRTSFLWAVGPIILVGAILCYATAAMKDSRVPEQIQTRRVTVTYEATPAPLPTISPTLDNTPTVAYRPISWSELVKFLEDDHTNMNAYDADNYVCLDFAADLVESAGKQNIKAWIVATDFYNLDAGHAFVGFETTDKGVLYIEPQSDIPYASLATGKPLCDAWTGTSCVGIVAIIRYVECDQLHVCRYYTP